MPISHGHHPYQYNQFVAPLESETLINELDLRQNLYDQGHAAIQAKMDELAGFDIARDQDRKYANQELAKIYNVIQSNSSKDFSNPQIVRSFLDISKPLENDSTFKNALDSTAELRYRQKTLADIRKKPSLYHMANEEDFLSDLKDWQSNPNAGAILGHKNYVPYQDISKKVMDIAAKLKADEATSTTIGSKWLTESQKKELSAKKLHDAILKNLNPDELNQMQIDANYTANHTDNQTKFETLLPSLRQDYLDLQEWSNIKNVENQTSNTQHYTQEDFARQAKAVKEKIDALEAGDENLLNTMYANAHISDFQKGIGSEYAYKEESTKLTANPYGLKSVERANAMSNFKEQHAIMQQNAIELIRLRDELGTETDANGNVIPKTKTKAYKDQINAKESKQQLDLFGVTGTQITNNEYKIPLNTSNSSFESTADVAVRNALTNLSGAADFKSSDWFDSDGNLKSSVILKSKIDDKGEVEYELDSNPDDKDATTYKLSKDAMKQFLPATSSSQAPIPNMIFPELSPEDQAALEQ